MFFVREFFAQTGFSARPMSEKLSGDAFHHFGGFFKRSWRSNDIMWGRLDGVCQLLECLVSVDRLRRVGEDDDLRKVVRRRLQTFDFNEVFPGAGDNARTRLAAWMFKLVDDDGTRRAEACDKDFPGMRALLIEAAQRELLGEELRGIVTDAIFEQTEWNRYRVDSRDHWSCPGIFDSALFRTRQD